MNIFVRFEGIFCLCSLDANQMVSYATFMSTRKRSRKRRNPVQSRVLGDLLDGIDIIGELMSLPPYAGPRHHFEYRMARKEWDRMYEKEIKEQRAFKKLKKKKWIEDRRKGSEVVVKIYSNAVVASLKDEIIKKKEPFTNGFITLLSFDFPNTATKARNQWRGFIRRLGLKKEQLSVYSTTSKVADELCALIKILGAEKWIRVFIAHEKTPTPP